MVKNIIFAGFGGQGALFSGKVTAYAGLCDGLEVSWLPSYGPEMRGGTAYCHVILSDALIGSPLLNEATVLIAMNRPSFDKYHALVADNGVVIVDGSLVDATAADVGANRRFYAIPATKTAQKGTEIREPPPCLSLLLRIF
jgi:2-oxoglutarate ferredoxin oxidoreductase subunit gamma